MNAPRPRRLRTAPVAVAALLLVAASLLPRGVGAQEEKEPLLVLAASSLADVLPVVAAGFREETGRAVRFSFDATSRLAAQADAGAPADLFVSADEAWIDWLAQRNLLAPGAPRVVAGNELVFVVPAASGGPPPTSPGDLLGLGSIAVGGENVPAGRYARRGLAEAGVWDRLGERVVTAGSVRGVLEWVARNEVDGGVVYRTDAMAEPDVRLAFAFDPSQSGAVSYRAAVLAASPRPGAAASFLDYLGGPEGRAILRAAGFTVPPDGPEAGQAGAPAGQVAPGIAPDVALPSVASAIRLSLAVALLATLLGLVPAVALGWLLARHDFRGKALVSTLVLAPLVLPPVVTGFLLLTLLGRGGVLGSFLASMGVSVPFTLVGATIAALVVGLPLYVLSIRGAFEAVDPLYEELSWTLGEAPRRTFFRISLPLAMPGIAAGAILAFARALGEFGATVVLAGNVEGSTRTIALAVYTLLEAPSGRETTWILVIASVALSLVALLGFEALSRRQRRRVRDEHGR